MIEEAQITRVLPQAAFGDRAAISASALCLAHCLALPLAVSFFPAMARIAVFPEWFHSAIIAFALPVSGLAMRAGFRRHNEIKPVTWAALGLLLISLGAWGEWSSLAETGATVIGSLALTFAHVLNWRARRASIGL